MLTAPGGVILLRGRYGIAEGGGGGGGMDTTDLGNCWDVEEEGVLDKNGRIGEGVEGDEPDNWEDDTGCDGCPVCEKEKYGS